MNYTVKHIIDSLQQEDPTAICLFSKDGEGNQFSTLAAMSTVDSKDDLDEEVTDGFAQLPEGKFVIFYPSH